MSGTLVLAGGGKMGGALLAGWLNNGMGGADIIVVEPDSKTASAISEKHGVAVVEIVGDLDADLTPETVVFAVKPQSMDDVAPAYGGYAGPDTVFLSIAAGALGMARTMAASGPSLSSKYVMVLPAAVGRGITVAAANGQVTGQQKSRCDGLLGTVGDVAWINDEGLMDAVTAVSGSGPAYVFLLAESLAEAGREAGLPVELSDQLARATVAGAGELLHQSGDSATRLRENVASPGGTTAAALEVLMDGDGWQALMAKAVAAAVKRSRELAG